MAESSSADGGPASQDDLDDFREQDRFLPTANVARLMKRALPENSKIAKEAKDCIMECVSEFISFVTSEASDRCVAEKRKTINGEDILWAFQSLGFDSYCEVMKVYLNRYREATKLERAASVPPPPVPTTQPNLSVPTDASSLLQDPPSTVNSQIQMPPSRSRRRGLRGVRRRRRAMGW
ncbi:nuclear transcription factor Y subunit B-8 [Fimicolochytrium jonesii]|uniref:nuclear transcription factor Y subunit B-8 n=1 Tax=Fimicolochytrium jonesii TaxID=1396493 RepID=UPI0022FECB6B|nr:nuclear transcription factor Y subunit B-8 [Fimicolochytrium jonesii]KAI8816954.1 nuclear transcription factor Y subunit B-8 [Fimicolochytrium jonesii]